MVGLVTCEEIEKAENAGVVTPRVDQSHKRRRHFTNISDGDRWCAGAKLMWISFHMRSRKQKSSVELVLPQPALLAEHHTSILTFCAHYVLLCGSLLKVDFFFLLQPLTLVIYYSIKNRNSFYELDCVSFLLISLKVYCIGNIFLTVC